MAVLNAVLLVHPLFWADTDNPQLWSIDDGFLLGDALLVCAIAEKGATSRAIALQTLRLNR
jgi:alpha-glucosidase